MLLKKKSKILINELKKANLSLDFGNLNVVDYTWLARHKSLKYKDIILDYI
jgi:hypothetical protein